MKTTTKLLGLLSIPAALAFAPTTVMAADGAQPTGAFIGGHYGRFSTDNEDFDDDNDFYDVVIGGMLNPYFGVEGGYSDFGKLKGSFTGADLEADLTGYNLAVIGRLPIGERFGIYAKGGMFWWRSDISVDVLGARFKEDITGNEPFFGVGADFFVTEHFAIDAEYTRYKVDLDDSSLPDEIDNYENDIDTAKIGAKFYF